MVEHRRSKRLSAHLELNVSNLFKQDNNDAVSINSPITVTDVSKHGIGFISKDIFPLDYYFNAKLKLCEEDDPLYCVVKIIRCIQEDNQNYHYGCEFIGMASILEYIIDDYAMKTNEASDD